jgi:hypothetical protein
MIDQRQLKNVEYLNYLGSMITNYARFTREIKSRIAVAKAAFNKTKRSSPENWTLREKLVNCIALYVAEHFGE